MWINYDPVTGCHLANHRLAGATAGEDITDVIDAIVKESNFQVSAPFDGALAALEDGTLWDDSVETQYALEFVHGMLLRYPE